MNSAEMAKMLGVADRYFVNQFKRIKEFYEREGIPIIKCGKAASADYSFGCKMPDTYYNLEEICAILGYKQGYFKNNYAEIRAMKAKDNIILVKLGKGMTAKYGFYIKKKDDIE